MTSPATTDVLGEPYRAETLMLAPDDEGPVVATLVSRRAAEPTTKAVLYVHGFADYFFQAQYAEWWVAHGYDFYALDLRKYGRSIRPHQTPNYVTDLAAYDEELDRAWHLITRRDGHQQVVGSAHSTGGLVLALWAARRQPVEQVGMVLNSPWLDLQGPRWHRTVGTAIVALIARFRPRTLLPRTVDSYYARSLHQDHRGEWTFNLAWKPLTSWPIYLGWLAAVRRGHAQVHAGIEVGCPVLVLSSDATSFPRTMTEDVYRHDIVLDVDQIRRWSSSLGHQVSYVAVPGAMHDVVLSRAEPRARAYEEIGRWLTTYVDPASASLA